MIDIIEKLGNIVTLGKNCYRRGVISVLPGEIFFILIAISCNIQVELYYCMK